jgi:hypothetical protein
MSGTSELLEWLGLGLAVVFGGLNVLQFFHWWVDRKMRSVYLKNVEAAKESLGAIRAMCTEAIDKGEIINTDPTRQFVRGIAYMALNIEKTLGAIVPDVGEIREGESSLDSEQKPLRGENPFVFP